MATTLSSQTYLGGSLQVTRHLKIVTTGAGGGAIAVPHGMSYTPSTVVSMYSEDIAGPAAGPTIFLDTTTVTAGIDATNVYLFVAGPGTHHVILG